MERFAIRPRIYLGEGPLAALDALAGRRVLAVTDAFLQELVRQIVRRLT